MSEHTGLNPVIIIPAFNESAAIGSVLREIRQRCEYPVVVVDDASTDDTVRKARGEGAEVLTLPSQLGAWGATQTGLRYALRIGYNLAICMDADGQHEAAALDSLIEPVTSGVADVTIGACTSRGSRMRKIAWVLMKRTSGLALEDITSGYRVYNLQAMKVLAHWRASLLDYQDIGVLLLLQSQGLRIVDVEVAMLQRLDGGSRIFHSWLMVGYYMCHTLLLGVTKRRFRRASAALTSADDQ